MNNNNNNGNKEFDSLSNKKSKISLDKELDRIEKESSMVTLEDLFKNFFAPIILLSLLFTLIFASYKIFFVKRKDESGKEQNENSTISEDQTTPENGNLFGNDEKLKEESSKKGRKTSSSGEEIEKEDLEKNPYDVSNSQSDNHQVSSPEEIGIEEVNDDTESSLT